MISPYKIKWGGFSSLDFDVLTELSFDGDSGQSSTFLNKENITTEHYDGKKTIHRSKYQETLAPTITLIKNNYSDFSLDENRRILSWLTSNENPGYLEIFHDDSEVVSYRLFGNWTEVEQYKLGNSRVVGYVATFESNAPYAFSHKFTYPEVRETIAEVSTNDETNDYLVISKPTTFTLTCTSDEYNKVLFPKVTVVFGSEIYVPIDKDPTIDDYKMMPYVVYLWDEHKYINIPKYNYQGIIEEFKDDISEQTASGDTVNKYYYYLGNKTIYKGIKEEKEDKTVAYGWEIVGYVGAGVQIENFYTLNGEEKRSKTTLIGGTPNEVVVLDGTNKVISSTITPFRIIGDDFNWEWIPMAEGANNFTIIGNCQIKFEWIEPRKVGSL